MNKVIEKLILEAKENPDLEIITMCDNDIFFGDYGWSIGYSGWSIGYMVGVDVDYVWDNNEAYYVGKDDICEELFCFLENDFEAIPEKREITEEDVENLFNKLLQSGGITKKIIVKVGV